MQKIKILLVDDHVIVAESLTVLINKMDGIEVVASISNGWQVVAFLETNEVDVVLTDLQMPIMNGIEITIRIREKYPHIRVILLTMSEDGPTIKEALVAGVDAYLIKRVERNELERAIRVVASGHKFFSEEVVMLLAEVPNLNTPSGKETIADNPPLTPREIEIMQLIIQDLTNLQIAEKTFISLTTVETHRRNLMKKLNVNSAVGLLRYAMKHGLVK